LGEATTFPFIIYYVPLHEAHIQMAFCFEILKVGTPATLGPHNVMCRPPIEMRFNAKLALVKIFPMVYDTPPEHKEIGAIPDF
jgi:hypothetical protein